jgi:hypothetical protein
MANLYPEMTDPIVDLQEPYLKNILAFLADHSGCNPYHADGTFEDFVLGASALSSEFRRRQFRVIENAVAVVQE